MALENRLKGIIAISGLLAVVSMACVVKLKSPIDVTNRLSLKFGKLWIAAEILLFVLVGAAVDIRYTMQAGIAAVAMILLALVFRAVGVCLCMTKTSLNFKERLFLRDRLSSKKQPFRLRSAPFHFPWDLPADRSCSLSPCWRS